MIRVRATQLGFFGGSLRLPGAEFEVPEPAFSKTWMESLEEPIQPVSDEKSEELDETVLPKKRGR